MTAKKFLYLIAIAFVFVSCRRAQPGHETAKKEDVVSEAETPALHPEIIISTIISTDGDTLRQMFNNADQTCELELRGERIDLKQQRMASGIKYSNEHYVYTNWHGQTRLYKDEKLIFSHDQ